MSDTAQKIIQKNNFGNVITVVNKRSNELDMNEKADVLVTEIFDTELIGEGVLPTLRDAHRRLLKPNCKVIPSKADVKIQLIESDKLWKMNTFVCDENDTLRYSDEYLNCLGPPTAHEIQIDQLYPHDLKCLSKDTTISTFDFEKPFHYENNSRVVSYKKSINIEANGTVHGILFWWDLVLHEKENIILSMQPKWIENKTLNKITSWRDHWMQAVYYLKAPLNVKQNDILYLTMCHDDYSIWFQAELIATVIPSLERPVCSCNLHMLWPRERFAMLNNKSIGNHFQKLLDICEDDEVKSIFVIGENSLLPLWCAQRYKQINVTYFETSEFSKNIIQSMSSDNYLDNLNVVKDSEKFKNLIPDIVISEPYFSSSLLPWHHLRIWNIFTKLNKKQSTKIYPSKAALKICVVSFKELWKVRAPVCKIENFDLSNFDDLISSALQPIKIEDFGEFESIEPFAVWEFENKKLTPPVSVTEFQFSDPLYKNTKQFTGKIENIKDYHTANGVVIWMDFEVRKDAYWSTGLDSNTQWVNYSKQGVYFLKEPLTSNMMKYDILFKPDENELYFNFS